MNTGFTLRDSGEPLVPSPPIQTEQSRGNLLCMAKRSLAWLVLFAGHAALALAWFGDRGLGLLGCGR